MKAKALNSIDLNQIPASVCVDLCAMAIKMAMKEKKPAATGENQKGWKNNGNQSKRNYRD